MEGASASDDEFGDINDGDLLLAATYAEQQAPTESPEDRASKRRKILPWNERYLSVRKPHLKDIPLENATDSNGQDGPIEISSQQDDEGCWDSTAPPIRLVGPQTNLRQTTLFGSQVGDASSQAQPRRHNWPRAGKVEPPTHHNLNHDELDTWVYPTNLGTIRDYQFNIVARGLYHNLLVALPTGLGKTFIAATIMLNWFRWTKDAQIVFVAPTKPLVAQQVEACFNIVGIPRSETTMLTGTTSPGLRAVEWGTKRVFFMTPQTIINDLKSGFADPKRVVLLVVDEAHRATGNYAYVEVVTFLRRFNTSFRVLALTATPGSTVEGVQGVIDNLGISRVEIRTEESLDIRQYVHHRSIDTTLFEPSEEMVMIMELYSKALQPLLKKIHGLNAYWSTDPMTLTPYGCTQARQKWMASEAGRKAGFGIKGMVNSVFSILGSLSHATELLKYHGIVPFYHKLVAFRDETLEAGQKGSKYKKEVIQSEHFNTMMNRIRAWVSDKDFIGHPKMEYLRSVVLNHFLDAGESKIGGANPISPAHTRIMIFVHFRDSAEEVARVLKRDSPMIRPHVFVGQANAKGSDGMDQKKQQAVVDKLKSGEYNTLVATSIGEEGLDIGEVDLIVCYDASASPIRMLQRMGRTGRKRAGKIEVLLMKGKEQNNFIQARDNYEKMQEMISDGSKFTFHEELSPRIMPKNNQPTVDKRMIDIPLENTQAELPEPKKTGRAPKRPPKKFHMPDNVVTGFTKASRLQEDSEDDLGLHKRKASKPRRSPPPVPVPCASSTFLDPREMQDLEKTYLKVGGEEIQTVETPKLDVFPSLQRSPRPVAFVKHGKVSLRLVRMLTSMHETGPSSLEKLEDNLRVEDRRAIDENRQLSIATRQRAVSSEGNSRDVYDLASLSPALDGQNSGNEIQRLHEAEDDDSEDDMADFIVNDKDLMAVNEKGIETAITSTPSSTGSPKPLSLTYNDGSPPVSSFASSLPDVDKLLAFGNQPQTQMRLSGKRRARRAVIESDSEDS